MVFVRNVSRLVRPAIIARCISPFSGPQTSQIVHSVASFPSWTPTRQLHSGPIHLEGASKTSVSINETLNLDTTSTESMESDNALNAALSSLPIETLLAKFEKLVQQASNTPIEQFEEIFKALALQRDFESCYKLLKNLRDAGVKPSSDLYSWAVRSGRRTLKGREVRELFGEKVEFHNPQREAPERVNNYEPTMYLSRLKEIVQMMTQDGAKFTNVLYDDLAFSLSATLQGGLLINIAITMEKRGHQPSTYYYNKMLYTLPRCGLSDRADVLFSRMVLNNLADQTSYIMRLGGLVYLHRLFEAEKCFSDLNKLYGANGIASNTMINGYLDEGQVDKALEVLETMKKSTDPKNQPNSVTFNTFVTYYYTSNDLRTCPAVLEYFTSVGFPASGADYGSLFKLFARNDLPRAEILLMNLLKQPALLNVHAYNAILHCLIDRKVSRPCRDMIGRLMVEVPHPIKPDSLAAICINASTDFRQILARMDSEGVDPSGVTYEFALRALRARNDLDAAALAYQHLQQVGLPIQSNHRNHYLAILAAKGDLEALKREVEFMGDRRIPIYQYNLTTLAELNVPVNLHRVRSNPRVNNRPKETSETHQQREY